VGGMLHATKAWWLLKVSEQFHTMQLNALHRNCSKDLKKSLFKHLQLNLC
jgi:hypothetical protein